MFLLAMFVLVLEQKQPLPPLIIAVFRLIMVVMALVKQKEII